MTERPVEFGHAALCFGSLAILALLTVFFHGLTGASLLLLVGMLAQTALCAQASPWLPLSSPLVTLISFWAAWFVQQPQNPFSLVLATLISFGSICAAVPLLRDGARKAIMNPKLRWWQVPVRVRRAANAELRPTSGGEMIGRTFEISRVGAFIPLSETEWRDKRKVQLRNLPTGTRCSFRIVLDHLNVIRGWAEVVRATSARGSYPEGFGIKFVSLSEEDRKILEDFLMKETAPAQVEASQTSLAA